MLLIILILGVLAAMAALALFYWSYRSRSMLLDKRAALASDEATQQEKRLLNGDITELENNRNIGFGGGVFVLIVSVGFFLWGALGDSPQINWSALWFLVVLIAGGLLIWLVIKFLSGIWQLVLVVLVVLAMIAGLLFVTGRADNVYDSVTGDKDNGVTTVNPQGATALNLDCTDLEISTGNYPSRVPGLVSPASGPSMLGLDAEELFEQICQRMAGSEVQTPYYTGATVPQDILYERFPDADDLNQWAVSLADDDVLRKQVFERLALLAFDVEWVNQEALGGENYQILTIDPAKAEVRPVIVTSTNFSMPVGGMSLWKITPVSYGDSALDEVASLYFEPSLGIFFIPRGVELGAEELKGEVDLGDFFGEEEEAEGEALDETTTSTAPDGTVTTTVTSPDGTVTTTVTTPDGTVTTTVTTPDGTSSTTITTPGGGGPGTTVPGPGTTVPGPGATTTTCPGCGSTTTTKPPTTTTTQPPTTTTTTTQPPTTTTTTTQPPTTTTTTTQPPTTTTTTQPAVQPDFKPFLSGSTSPWTFQLQIGNPADWCGFVSQNGKSLTPGSTKVYVSDLYVHDNGDKWLFVTGTPCNGTPKKTLKTNTVIWGY